MPLFGCLKVCAAVALLTVALGLAGSAVYARDMFTSLFNPATDPKITSPQPSSPSPQGAPAGSIFGDLFGEDNPKRVYITRSESFCVRTCDGRYFPVLARDGQSSAAACRNFCPASETKIFRGSSIDNASNEQGKLYSGLPNAFRYRNELVANCTCGGKGTAGLASISIEDDPTLRKGDLVASATGLMVAGDRNGRNVVRFTPASKWLRAQYRKPSAVAVR